MSEAHIFDVDESNFQSVVVENSHKLPVLVDFWAEWCQPCKALIPILHKLAEELAGHFILAKVNSDEQQALARQYGVRSLPTVKLFVNGEIVDEFTGLVPESQIRAMLGKHIELESDTAMVAALAEYQAGNIDAAIRLMHDATQMDKGNQRVQLTYAKVLIESGKFDEAAAFIQQLPADMQAEDEFAALQAHLDIAVAAGGAGVDELLARIAADANDFEARQQLSAVYMSQAQYQPALQELIEIMARDRSYKDDAGRKGLLKLFEILGNDNPLVGEYRRRMASLMN